MSALLLNRKKRVANIRDVETYYKLITEQSTIYKIIILLISFIPQFIDVRHAEHIIIIIVMYGGITAVYGRDNEVVKY